MNLAAGASEMDHKACVAAGERVGNKRINGSLAIPPQFRSPCRRVAHRIFTINRSTNRERYQLFRLLDHVLERKPTGLISFFDQTIFNGANFFRGFLGANVIFADVKNHGLYKLEGMRQH
jgi:hypothetical protein